MRIEKIKEMDLNEFIQKGYLQEANRLFFHPLGLALEVAIDKYSRAFSTCRIWDYREDDEGIVFNDLSTDEALRKSNYVEVQRKTKEKNRQSILGFTIQPIGDKRNDA